MNMYVVMYDIADPKRLAAIAKICEKYLIRVQKSVFEGDLGKAELHAMRSDIEDTIEPSEDVVFIYTVPRVAVKDKIILGKEPDHPYIIT
nr:CRISPR-associated endonuclease Cas2 [Candidatus Sigynarchaeota archaeon]